MNGKLFLFFLLNVICVIQAKITSPFQESGECLAKGCGSYQGKKPGMEIKKLYTIPDCGEEIENCSQYNLVMDYTLDYEKLNPETDEDVYFISYINFCNNGGLQNITNYETVHHTKLVTPYLPETIYTQTISIQIEELHTEYHYPLFEMLQIEILDGMYDIERCLASANWLDQNTDEHAVGIDSHHFSKFGKRSLL